MTTAKGYVAGDTTWSFPELGEATPPGGAKVLILTEGGICIQGAWQACGGFVAWAPLPKVDKVKLARVYQLRRNELVEAAA